MCNRLIASEPPSRCAHQWIPEVSESYKKMPAREAQKMQQFIKDVLNNQYPGIAIQILPLDPHTLHRATQLLHKYAPTRNLHSLDSIVLASVHDPANRQLITHDRILRSVAAEEGITVLP